MNLKYIFLFTLSVLHVGSEESPEQCSKDDLSCTKEQKKQGVMVDESLYNSYEKKDITSREDFLIREELDHIDQIKSEKPDLAMNLVKRLLKDHPESPRALYTQALLYKILYSKLSTENKSIGKIEYLVKMLDNVKQIMKMHRSRVPTLLYTTAAELGLNISNNLAERDTTIEISKELVYGDRREEFNAEDSEFYFQTLLDQTFFSGDFEATKKLVIERTENVTYPSINMRLLMAMMTRIEEKNNIENDPFKRYNEALVEQTAPSDQEEKDELFLYSMELDKELRKLDKIEYVNIMYDLLAEMKYYPSRYQRTTTHVHGLTARPIWTKEQSEYKEKLDELENNWEKIRDEAINLVTVTPPENVTYGERSLNKNRKWKQYIFHGFGQESFPDSMCALAPTTCALLKDFPYATQCPLGTIKFSVIEPGAYIQPHVGGVNAKLRVHLPLVVPKPNITETANMARMLVAAEHEVTWEEGKVVIFDDSFEHEVWNETSEPRIILIVDVIHPDMTEKQFAELNSMFKFQKDASDDGAMAVHVDNMGPK